jgi:hypothetical protein
MKTEEEFKFAATELYNHAKEHNVPLIMGIFFYEESEITPFFAGEILDRLAIMDVIQEQHSISIEQEIIRLKEANKILIEEMK